MWSGSAASGVDLNPSWLSDSSIRDISGNTQVGIGGGAITGGAPHAVLWNGTAASAVDLHPFGWTFSDAYGVSAAGQLGEGLGLPTSGLYHALYWNGTAGSVIDLHSALTGLGPVFTQSVATSISDDGAIVGYAFGDIGGTYAILWTPVPEPTSCALLLGGFFVVSLLGSRRLS